MLFRGHSVRGQLILDPKAEAWLRRYDDEPMHVEITPVHARRSVPQNRRMWAGYNRALKSAATLCGFDKDELHDALKQRSEVIPEVPLYTPWGERIGISKSTRRLSVQRMGDYMEEFTALFARGGIDLYPETSA